MRRIDLKDDQAMVLGQADKDFKSYVVEASNAGSMISEWIARSVGYQRKILEAQGIISGMYKKLAEEYGFDPQDIADINLEEKYILVREKLN